MALQDIIPVVSNTATMPYLNDNRSEHYQSERIGDPLMMCLGNCRHIFADISHY